MLKPRDTRALAAQTLAAVFAGQSLSHALPHFSAQAQERDKPLLQELCFGCLRYTPAFECVFQQLVTKPLKNKDNDVKALILLGFYQLDYTRIPDHAAINATVDAAKHLNKDWACAFINGVLRQYQREKSTLQQKFAKNPRFTYAHPQWLADKLIHAWPDHWPAVLSANNAHPPFTLRVNLQRCTREDYLQHLQSQGHSASPCRFSAAGISLHTPVNVHSLPYFAEGWVSVQDEAAQLAAPLLAVAPQHRVLDACCAPGGKTAHLLESQPQLAHLTAIDLSPERLQRVAENLHRLQLHAQLLAADAAQPNTWWDGIAFDRILLDAPCSATGVIRRHPDIKSLRRSSDIAALAKLQLQLLQQLWPCLAPGGRLLYATCSILPEENTRIISQFMAATPNATALPLQAEWGLEQPFGRQILPHQHGQDGFYYALLEKSA